ncbi:MAG: hypothetical protein JWM15_2410 [Cryptosporangiaceae bacterium]|jgi:hypothetical protein|nr:hypothetical protein [Cryptosporangiaceae bacterium]
MRGAVARMLSGTNIITVELNSSPDGRDAVKDAIAPGLQVADGLKLPRAPGSPSPSGPARPDRPGRRERRDREPARRGEVPRART